MMIHIEELKERFGAELAENYPDEEQLRFLDKRAELEQLCCWDFNAFVKHYQLIEKYALEEKLLESLAIRIERFMDLTEIEELKETEFFRKFGNHRTISGVIINKTE